MCLSRSPVPAVASNDRLAWCLISPGRRCARRPSGADVAEHRAPEVELGQPLGRVVAGDPQIICHLLDDSVDAPDLIDAAFAGLREHLR